MIYALDTSIISYLLRPSHNEDVVKHFENELERGNDYVIPPLSYYEIKWYLLRKKATAQLSAFEKLYQNTSCKLNMSEADFISAAKIRAENEERGIIIGDCDILIAAYCLVNDYTIVTNNTRHFKLINGLKFANWKEL